jgi:hypothetical protein
VLDLQALQASLDETRAKIVAAMADADAGVAPTLEQLQAQIRDQDAGANRMREVIAERLRALAPLAHNSDSGLAPVHEDRPLHDAVARPPGKTFVLQRPLMHGADVQAFQRLLNRRLAAWGVHRRIAENGTYGPKTRQAAHQVALGLGLLGSDLEHGITPQLRIVMRTPSRRTDAQKRRAAARGPYRAALRRRYAKRRAAAVAARHDPQHAPANGNGNGGAPTVATRGIADAIRAHGGQYEGTIVAEARRFGVPVALVCAVIDVESGFTNVFGHDKVRNPIKSPPRPAPDRGVTPELYAEYNRHRKLGEGSQGVGPMQLTFFTLQDEADALGGCFHPQINIHVGVKHLAGLIRAHGLRDGVQRYNGARGHAYADLVLARRAVWEQRLGARSTAPVHAPAAVHSHHPVAAKRVPPTYRLRTPPLRSAGIKRLQRDINRRFARWGIARTIAEDGVFGKDTERAAHQVLIALGVAAAAYERGITPRLRVVIRDPGRRTTAEKLRARDRRGYRAKLRTRYGAGARPAVHGQPVAVKGSPKAIIDAIVIPLARKNGIMVTPASVEAANKAHSLNTTSGKRSDHKGPPSVAWAADMSNGGSPTPQMDALAADLAATFGIPWSGSGLVNHTAGGYRYQLIYRTNEGGNHFNHVHLGVKKL